jgi:phage gp36-like protein
VYATVGDVQEALAGDGDPHTVTAAALPLGRVAAAILSAESEVDARLAGRYRVPFDPVPQLVRDVTVGIAAYVADLGWRGGVDYESEQDPVLLAHARAQRLLTGLADGSIVLPEVDDDDDGQPDTVVVTATHAINPYDGRLFGPGDYGLQEWRRGVFR